jgi:L-iditol 2-dehydrogenase
MKAAFLVGANQYQVRDVPNPIAPDDGVLLRVEACGICGSDLRRWREGPSAGSDGIVAGHEIAGVVSAVGKDHIGYSVGDRLAVAPDVHCGRCYYCERDLFNLCDDLKLVGITPGYGGGFAEQMILTREILENGIVHRIPDGLGANDAALAEPLSSVLVAHERAGTTLGDVVVVMGAGPIGCLHIAIAHTRGAQVILSEPSAVRRGLAKPFAPELIVDPAQDDLNARVREFTRGVGADIVICANPVAATQTQAVEIARKRGKVILFGGLPKANPIASLDANRIHYGEIELIGSFSYHPIFHTLALDVIRRGLIPMDKIITHRYSLEQVNAAFTMASGGAALKVVIQ